MIEAPHLTHTNALHTAIIPLVIPRDEMEKVFGACVGELIAAMAAQGSAPAGPLFTHHLEITPEFFNFEMGFPVSTPVVAAGRMKPGQWPAMKAARTVYQGPYEGLPAAWGEFMDWMETHGHQQAPDLWECYLTNPDSEPDPAKWRTELNRPLMESIIASDILD